MQIKDKKNRFSRLTVDDEFTGTNRTLDINIGGEEWTYLEIEEVEQLIDHLKKVVYEERNRYQS